MFFKSKADNENVNFPTQFCLGSIYNGFGDTEYREVSLKGNVYNQQYMTQATLINLHPNEYIEGLG